MIDILEQTKGCVFDYGGTLDTGGCHWGRAIWHAYRRQQVPVEEQLFREAYVYAERELGRNPIIQPSYTFLKTLSVKLRIEMEHIAERRAGFDPTRPCSTTSTTECGPRRPAAASCWSKSRSGVRWRW